MGNMRNKIGLGRMRYGEWQREEGRRWKMGRGGIN